MKSLFIVFIVLGISTSGNAMTKKLHERINQDLQRITQADQNPVAQEIFNSVLEKSKGCFSYIMTFKDGTGDTWATEAATPKVWQSECEEFSFENGANVLVYRDNNWNRYYFAAVNFERDWCDVAQPHGIAIYRKLDKTNKETGLADDVKRVGVIATGEFETCYDLPVLNVIGINYKRIKRYLQY